MLNYYAFGQPADKDELERALNGEWQFKYEIDSNGVKDEIRFWNQENDSCTLKIKLTFKNSKLSIEEKYKYESKILFKNKGTWEIYEWIEGRIFLNFIIEDIFVSGIYELKIANENELILIECDKHDNCEELYFLKKK